jgi:hypothetical protein
MRTVTRDVSRFLRAGGTLLGLVGSLSLAGCGSSTPKHLIGGTVSGLAGSGLTLHSSTGDDLSVTTGGAFTFPTSVKEGTDYTVNVSRQPTSPSQVCTVANGTGTMGGADVTSVAVTCATSTFSIGGTVSGLAGTVVLQDNGGDDLTISANGAFSFTTKVASGASFAVSVKAQPSAPAQDCIVTGGAGTVGAADVTSVAVTCTIKGFAVGGTVSGLAGTVVLQDNGGDDLTITANGAFAFTTKVASGGTYAVTVKTQPGSPSQVCTVTGGTGTVGAADVTAVAVTCVTSTFAIGGTVSGLAGTVVLQDNGGDDLTITANGAFAFATKIASGGTYAVTVKTQPASPSQVCTVTGGTGTVGAAAVTGVAVTCVTSTFSIGGTVGGLVGTGLVLHSDFGAGEDLPVGAGATAFTFARKVPSGTTVAISVKAQPTSPTEACSIQGSPVIVGAADVSSLSVSCTTALQRWVAPSTWGGLWPDAPTMREHAYFDGTRIVETKGIGWTVASGTLPAQRELKIFPEASRWGAGPFNGPRYQASAGDGGLDFPTDMLVCAVVKPDFNPVVDGGEHVIIGKGIENQAGWVLVQKHHMFNFLYRFDDGLGNDFTGNAYTPTYFADQSLPDNGPLNPSYMVVCGGRSGDTLIAAANNFPDAVVFPYTLPAGARLHTGTTPHRLTVGGYDDNSAAHGFGGRVFETAVWNEPATAANIQAKFDAILGLSGGTRYTRNREGPFVGLDGQYHTSWRNAPRAFLPDAAKGLGGGLLFGLQGWNRLTAPYTPPAFDLVSQVNPVVAYGEALDLWTRSGGASVQKDQLTPPGDSEQNGAERVTLPAGAAISRPLGFFDTAGPIHGMLWIRPVSASGTLRVRTTNPASGQSQQDLSLATFPAGQWTRVWLSGLTNDGSQTVPATLSLTNAGSTPIDFYAWGVDLTQIGRGGNLGSFDPGVEMYDWNGSANNDAFPIDVLQLPAVPTSTSATGFCLSVEAQPPPGLAWTAPFVADRSPLTWVSDTNPADGVNIFMSGTGNPSVPHQNLCAFVSSAPTICWAPTWAPGTQHTITVCAAPNGNVSLLADGAPVGTPQAGAAPFDLSSGHLVVGSNSAAKPVSNIATWQGFITKVAVCPAGNPSACR